MTELINPYIAGNPVTGEEMFFGREDIFTFIRQTLTGQHRDQVIVLYGQRRTGKTSILYQMHRRLDPRYLCIFIDLHGLFMENEATFLWELASQIRRVLARDHQIELPQPGRASFESDARNYFSNDFLDEVWRAIGDRHILLMIDEAVRLQEQVQAGKLDKSIFEYLRHLMQHYERLNFLFSIGSGLEQMEKEYAFLFNVALYKKISFLERRAAVHLVTQPVQAHYRVEPAAVDRILEVTACHPYFTQLLCHSLFNRWRQQDGDRIGAGDVEAVMAEVVERGLAVLKHTWEDSTPGEKAVIAGLAAAMGEHNRPVDEAAISQTWQRLGVTLPDDELAKAMRSLAARDIITGGEQPRFTVDLQHFWVRKFQRLEWVREEIRESVEAWRQPAPSPAALRAAPSLSPAMTETIPAAAPPARRNIWFVLLGAAAVLVIGGVLMASILDWGPFGREPAVESPAGADSSSNDGVPGGVVVPGGDTLLVNDLALAGDAIWAATDGGLVRWSPQGEAISISGDDIGFPEPANQALAVADDGTLWIGGGGVSHVVPEPDGVSFLNYYDQDDDLGMGAVRALMTEEGGVWAGGSPSGDSPLSWFDGESWDPFALSLEEPAAEGLDLSISSLLRDFDGNLWLGLARDGILRWDGENWTHWGPEEGVGGSDEEVDTRVRGLVQDDQGNIWAAAGYRGLLVYVPDTDSWERALAAEITHWVTAVAFVRDGAIWVGQEDGKVLRSYDYSNTWDVIAEPDAVGVDITAIVLDDAGNVFVSSYGGGVSVYDLYDDGEWIRLQQ
jgi:hypothetical protein